MSRAEIQGTRRAITKACPLLAITSDKVLIESITASTWARTYGAS